MESLQWAIVSKFLTGMQVFFYVAIVENLLLIKEALNFRFCKPVFGPLLLLASWCLFCFKKSSFPGSPGMNKDRNTLYLFCQHFMM